MNELKLTDNFYMIDLALDRPSWMKIIIEGPTPCARAAYGIVAVGKEIFVCGGLGDEGALADLWKFNIGNL